MQLADGFPLAYSSSKHLLVLLMRKMSASKSKMSQPPSRPRLIKWCQDVRPAMLAASALQLVASIAVVVIGSVELGLCSKRRFADWSMVYGGLLFGCSSVTVAAAHGRQRRILLTAIAIGLLTGVIGLAIDGTSYFCVDLRGGVNRGGIGMCEGHIYAFNACRWVSEYQLGYKHLEHSGGVARLTMLICVMLYLCLGVGIMTTALTEGGRVDMCQFEEAIRELKEVNQNLSYRKRARRHRILTQYISQAKPEESQSYGTKMMRFFGFGTDVEPVPMEQRKIKITLPKGAKPSSQSTPAEQT